MEEIAKGKRGIVYLLEEKGRKYAVKVVNPKSKSASILEKEKLFLEKLNKAGIGPRFFSLKDGALKMEFVEGQRILEFFEDKKTTKKDILLVIQKVLEQCHTMDKMGINKFEMTNPYKHILIYKNNPVMIDFERARFTKKPKNVTQFVQFLVSQKVSALLKQKGIETDRTKLLGRAAQYRQDREIEPILACFQG